MRITCLQHMAIEAPARIADWAQARGHVLDTRHVYQGAPLPAPTEFEMLLVMGGAMGVYDSDQHPWMTPEIALVRRAIDAGRRVLGICLGSQILAAALDAPVYPHSEKEIGWFPVRERPGSAGTALEGLIGESKLVLHWHGDTFDLPAGAALLASSEATVNQAFSYGPRVLGLQFHLELGPAHVRTFVQRLAGELDGSRWVQTAEEILAAGEAFAATEAALYTLLDRFTA